ncbi:MAG: undecaprenyl-diphosphate phosphatase [Bacillota bacterium]|nr:undecaprenyl-diphosphate phosphatase [Bacillota bacterium]
MWINILFILKTIIIGIVEGFTEFLPVSSTGHMIITEHIIGFMEGVQPAALYDKVYIDMFTEVIQLGAILAIIVLYWDKIINTLRPSNIIPSEGKKWLNMPGFKFWLNIVIAAIPGVILGFLFKKKIEGLLFFPKPVAGALIFGALLMIYAENKYRKKATVKDVDAITIKQAFIIGCFQCLAIVWPGMSRSASTIIGAWIVGLTSVAGAEFSFFLAIPMMFGASIVSVHSALKHLTMNGMQIVGLGVGFLVSFVVALVVVEKFVKFLQKKPMRIFAVYRIFVGILILILAFANVIS